MSKKKQILVVDDMAVSLSVIERTLQDTYEIVTMNSGIRALRYLEIYKPDLILLDIRMAVKDGIETLREMREIKNGQDVPVIMLTSAQDRKSVIESSKLGIYDYVIKPFDPKDLRDRIHYVFTKIQLEKKEKAEQKARADAEKGIFEND